MGRNHHVARLDDRVNLFAETDCIRRIKFYSQKNSNQISTYQKYKFKRKKQELELRYLKFSEAQKSSKISFSNS
jgi:hypothetical protein